MTKYILGTIAIIIAAAVATCAICYRVCGEADVRAAVQKGDALEWLRSDFNLNETQFAAVKRLHESYGSVCEEHCRAIQEAAGQRESVKQKTPGDAAALAAAQKKVDELREVCETAITAHVRQVAAQMSPEQGARYLALVLPKIKDFDHQGAANLLVEHRH